MEEKEIMVPEGTEIEEREVSETKAETLEDEVKAEELQEIQETIETPLESEEEMKARVKEEVKKERRANTIEWIKDIIVAAILASIILTFFKPIIIQQESMLNTYLPGDYVIISRQAYKLFGDVERGDVVVFKTDLQDEMGRNKNLIKRIIGLPGDRVEVREDGYVYINGELLDEPYLKDQGISDEIAGTVDVVVGEDEIFACGDNREVSYDSRAMGCIEQDTIMGKVICLVFNTEGARKDQ